MYYYNIAGPAGPASEFLALRAEVARRARAWRVALALASAFSSTSTLTLALAFAFTPHRVASRRAAFCLASAG